MKIWEFVVTGGPCAGKTTALSILKEDLISKGFNVIMVAETATELISSGICPWNVGKENFQALLIERSINKELTTRKAAEYLNSDTVIIYDRGLLDGKAYVTQEFFLKELQKYNLNEEIIREQYDGIFHLVTAADGAEEFYTLSNNEARTETIEEARELDRNTRNAWIEHQNLKIIDNSTDFQNKINRLLQEVYLIMGLPNQ